MKKYKTKEGDVVQGATASQIVNQMRDGGFFTKKESQTEYMKGFAERYRQLSGKTIEYDTPEKFVESLLKAGYLEALD